MDLINKKLLIELYSEYINDSQYVYYKANNNIIIIMKKMSDDLKCISNINFMQYYSDTLKVILMYEITDPYKLVLNISHQKSLYPNVSKYKINEIVSSICYLTIYEAYNLHQCDSYIYGHFESNICNAITGLYQEYYNNGQIRNESQYIDGKYNGIRNTYYKNGK